MRNRRAVLGTTGVLLAAGLSSVWGPPGRLSAEAVAPSKAVVARSTTPPRPNVLVITADDMRADDLRWMPKTRHQLAANGLVFRNAFAPNPLCAPSRASLLTGEYSHNHRVLSHSEPFGFGAFDDTTTLATVLSEAGYQTALVGKYLNGYGQQPTHADHLPSVSYVPPGWSQWWGSLDHVDPADGGAGGGTYKYFHLTSNVNGQVASWPGPYTTNVTAGQTQALVEQFGQDEPNQPWFIWWTPVAPHAGAPHEPDDPGTIRRSDGRPFTWLTPARPRWSRHLFSQLITHGAGTPPGRPSERRIGDKPQYLRSMPALTARENLAERDVTRQRAQALAVLDLRIGDTLATLRRTGQASRTIVVFDSDNGFYLGEHRKRAGKSTLHEPSIRIPLIMAGPGIPQGTRYDPATVEDLAATIADWAGTRLPRADGVSLRQTIEAGDQGWTRPVVLEGVMSSPPYPSGTAWSDVMQGLQTIGIRTAQYAFIRYSTGESELYDLRADPLQLTSLNPKSAPALEAELGRVWDQYAACAGEACQVPLPPDLSTRPRFTARITDAQEKARRQYYRY